MYNNNFFDNSFKVLVLSFWPVILYKWISVSSTLLEPVLFIVYLFLSVAYLLPVIHSTYKKNNFSDITFLYRFSTIVCYNITLCSFLLFPTNLLLLFIKMVSILIYFYISSLKLFKHKMDEGLVGVIASMLLAFIMVNY